MSVSNPFFFFLQEGLGPAFTTLVPAPAGQEHWKHGRKMCGYECAEFGKRRKWYNHNTVDAVSTRDCQTKCQDDDHCYFWTFGLEESHGL